MSDETTEEPPLEKEPELEPTFPFTFLRFDPDPLGVDTLPENDAQADQ